VLLDRFCYNEATNKTGGKNMKHTKRLLSLILALSLCLSLTACASADDKAFEEADALLAAGDYEGAIAAFSSIGRYQEISAKIAEAEKLHQETQRMANLANAEALFGNWVNVATDFIDFITLTLNSDGTSVLAFGDEVYNSTFDFENNTLSINNPYFAFSVETVDGLTHLVSGDMGLDMVPEANYSEFALQEIELTIDNWQEYFEMKEVNGIRKNSFGEVEAVYPTVGIFLKEEYYDRLPEYFDTMNIAFELTYDETPYVVPNCTPEEFQWDFAGQYEREPATKLPSWWEVPTGCTADGTLNDNRNSTWIAEESPYFNTVSCEIYAIGSAGGDQTMYLNLWTNIQMNRVTGTLPLFPAK